MNAPRVVVVGLGPAGPDLVTEAAREAIARVPTRFLRTTRHPAAMVVGEAASFDAVYERGESLEQVYEEIAAEVAAAARAAGEVLYAVPGSPVVGERTVELLRAAPVDLEVVPAMSFVDLAWCRLCVDPVALGARVVDGHRFAVEAAGERGPLLVAQCDSVDVLSAVKLAFERDAPARAVVLQRLGLPDERILDVAFDELDRPGVVEPDHLTSVWLPEAAAPVAAELVGFAEVVRRLREECPWDRVQTHQSLTRYVVEETYEVVEAIASGDPDRLEDELGDLLLQVFLHAAIAAQAGEFTLADVAARVTDKMVRRHPHVFAGAVVDGAEHVSRNWDAIKAAERQGEPTAASALDGVPGSAPALLYASELSRKAAKVGFDWDGAAGVWEKLGEELDELRRDPGDAGELGDVLFVLVTLARHLGHDAEGALRAAAAKFRDRFHAVERIAAVEGVVLGASDAETLDALWQRAKAVTSG